ncbi:HAAS signaling domain-containing protein [Aquimarina sp. 2201CG14-23]|uniref:HAAS signaling domain-containing protein n=1 Tax=Aquimarina mycalae TaxID=3040073 RepID=UPI0024781379|nr:DUF1700 domain-containing protein [Aquimarina sp. 2201CG14-23]MDH7446092.1 hypothetical protein [Aquimarina sp. 2201CG14-23]
MKAIEFKNKSAKKIYDSYFRRIRRTIKVLSSNDQEDVLMEFNSHIYEALTHKNEDDEVTNLLEITQELGDPEIVLKSLVAEKKLNQATKTFNPKHIFQAITLNTKRSGVFFIFVILYLSLFLFVVLIISEIRYPEQTGLFFSGDEFVALGRLETQRDVTEVLGNWFIPIIASITLFFYLLTTLLMKLTKKK